MKLNAEAPSFYPSKNTQVVLPDSPENLNLESSISHTTITNVNNSMLTPSHNHFPILTVTDKDIKDIEDSFFTPEKIVDIIDKANILMTKKEKKPNTVLVGHETTCNYNAGLNTIKSLIPYIEKHNGMFLTEDIRRIGETLDNLPCALQKEVLKGIGTPINTPPGFVPLHDNQNQPIRTLSNY